MITARVIEDSISEAGKRITTFVLTYPRFVHAELMTHRMFSRNAASSRAIPIKRMIERAQRDPAVPVHWGKNKSGMQAVEELSGWRLSAAKTVWFLLMNVVIVGVKLLDKIGLHKQIANRPLEAWFNIEIILTATEFDNFYNLRLDKDAQPEIRQLALCMFKEHQRSKPKLLKSGEWHLPFISAGEKERYDVQTLLKYSVARCARVSYLNHDKGNPDLSQDAKTHERLLKAGHVSPFEHQATPQSIPTWNGNFFGWNQYRKNLINENRSHFDVEKFKKEYDGDL